VSISVIVIINLKLSHWHCISSLRQFFFSNDSTSQLDPGCTCTDMTGVFSVSTNVQWHVRQRTVQQKQKQSHCYDMLHGDDRLTVNGGHPGASPRGRHVHPSLPDVVPEIDAHFFDQATPLRPPSGWSRRRSPLLASNHSRNGCMASLVMVVHYVTLQTH